MVKKKLSLQFSRVHVFFSCFFFLTFYGFHVFWAPIYQGIFNRVCLSMNHACVSIRHAWLKKSLSIYLYSFHVSTFSRFFSRFHFCTTLYWYPHTSVSNRAWLIISMNHLSIRRAWLKNNLCIYTVFMCSRFFLTF